MIPDSYLNEVKAHGMEMDEGFPIPAWDIESHLKSMDEAQRLRAALHAVFGD